MTNHRNIVTPADPKIIGFWKEVGGDYILIDEYRSEGMVIQHVGDQAGKPSPFRTEGDYVFYALEQPGGGMFEQKTRYEISEDMLTFIHSPKKQMHFQKVHEA